MGSLWHWVPGTSIGPFTFGDRIEPYITAYGLRKRRPDCSLADWDTYEFPGFESWIVVENNMIIEVYCSDKVDYKDQDLIGMHQSDVRDLLGKEDNKEQDVGLGYALYYEGLGLTLFLVDEVVSAAVCGRVFTKESSPETTSLARTQALAQDGK